MQISVLKKKDRQISEYGTLQTLKENLETEMSQYWGDRSLSYSEQNMAQLFGDKRQAWEDIIFRDQDKNKVLNVLDIGTGPGFFAILSALRGHNVTAVDMCDDMLYKAMKNAALVGAKVKFMQVGALLPFEDKTFDLIISRDVTWTLTEPEKQLRSWAMKLKDGGTMLYFDSEWYYYLRNNEYRLEWEKKKEKIIENGGFIYGKATELEKLAINLPMTYKKRPLWDTEYWHKQNGFKCNVDLNLNSYIYNEKEQMQYEAFPEFLVKVWRDFDESY